MRHDIARIVANLLWKVGGLRVSESPPFRLTSGNMSPLYVDCRLLITHPVVRDMITSFAHWLYETEKLQSDYIAGGETAGIPYASWLAERLNKPFVYVRKEAKVHGRAAQVEGDFKPGGSVLLYEDLVTDGKSKLVFIRGIRDAGGEVNNCLVVFDRQQGGMKELAGHGVTLYSLTDLHTAVNVGLETGRFCDQEYQSIQEYLRDPRAWHIARGFEFRD